MIVLENVWFSYGEKQVLRDFFLTVPDGGCVCLFGPSGCGKTTALRLVMGLEKPEQGRVLAPHRVSVVFQEDRLLPHLSVMDNLLLPGGSPARAMELLKQSDLDGVADKRIRSLSGGMRRRVALLRALLFDGEALILDEPFNGLDADNRRKMAELIRTLFLQRSKPVLLVTHDREDAALLNAEMVLL